MLETISAIVILAIGAGTIKLVTYIGENFVAPAARRHYDGIGRSIDPKYTKR